MIHTATFFTLLSVALLVKAQLDCPDVSTACQSNPCESNSTCPRYFNADCVVNTCAGLCKPNFFFRARNVTERCDSITCETRDCGPYRQCMEEVSTAVCRRQICRQRLRTRCIRIPRPMSCADVDCGEGMVCFMRERGNRHPVVRCIPAPATVAPPTTTSTTVAAATTQQSTSPLSTIPTSPPFTGTFTTLLPVTVTPTPPTQCSLDCSSLGQQCVLIPFDGPNGQTITTPVCLPIIGLSCEDITCPQEQTCVLQSFVERDLEIAQCLPIESVNSTAQTPPSSCTTTQCPQGNVCIDVRIDDRQFMGVCLATGCINDTECGIETGNICAQLPPGFDLNFDSVCVPSFVDAQFGSQSCNEMGRICPTTLVCRDAFIGDSLISTFCNVNPFPTQCDEIVCSDGECVLTSSAFVNVASCVSDLDSVIQTVQQLLELLGLVQNSTTDAPTVNPTEILSTLGTIAPTSNSQDCFFNCSDFGQICDRSGSFPQCVNPPTCTENFIDMCFQRSQACNDSSGMARCVVATSCEQIQCNDGFKCFELPPNLTGQNTTSIQCLLPTAITCEELSCSQDNCFVTEVPSKEIIYAQCVPDTMTAAVIFPMTCETLNCGEGSVCVDLQINGLAGMGICLSTNCNNATCGFSTTCTAVPSEIVLPFDSLCVPSNIIDLQFGTQTCASIGRTCSDPTLVCHEAAINGNIVGTACSPFSFLLTSTCVDTCGEDECFLSSVGERSIQFCLRSALAKEIIAVAQFLINSNS